MVDDLDCLADKLRRVMTRLYVERESSTLSRHWTPLPWEQLMESEKNQWRDHARACTEVMADADS